MATYSIYAGPRLEDAVFVREGFSPAAAVFTFAWAFYHRMWVAGTIALALMLLASQLPPSVQLFSDIALMVVFGVFGNDMREWSLARRGLAEVDILEAPDLERAEMKFYTHVPKRQPQPLAATDVLGLFDTR